MSKQFQFIENTPTLDNQWRAIILFGRNTASYKFSLAKALLENPQLIKSGEVSLQDLALPYAQNICEHLKNSDKQITAKSSRFLDACRNFNSNKINKDQLIENTVELGFNNVLDAFHIVNQRDIPDSFFKRSQGKKSIIITDNFFQLVEEEQDLQLSLETEARWRLVETAWSLNLNRQLIDVHHDSECNTLYTLARQKRNNITSSRHSLNGYQKGHCFYCLDQISIEPSADNLAEVDHFFPHILKRYIPNMAIDGVWNLVLACQDCNRGENGKFALIPDITYLHKLSQRNEYIISSHHPLRETLIRQTGKTTEERNSFLQKFYNIAIGYLIHTWRPVEIKSGLLL